MMMQHHLAQSLDPKWHLHWPCLHMGGLGNCIGGRSGSNEGLGITRTVGAQCNDFGGKGPLGSSILFLRRPGQ